MDKNFTLVSGRKSKYYIDVKNACTKPDILKIISRHILRVIKEDFIETDYIACVELGGIPIGVIVSVDMDLPLIIIRKGDKKHGLKSRFIGDFEYGKVALLVEDVTTTGGSVISAAQALRKEGLIVSTVISVVDREEGAEENLSKKGLKLIHLVKAKALIQDYEIAEALRHSDSIKQIY